MTPTVVHGGPEADLHEGSPLGSLGLAHETHVSLGRSAVGLARVAGNAGADDVFPSRGPTPISRNHVVEVQIAPIKDLAAVLAGVLVPLEQVVPGEFDFLLGKTVKPHEQDDPGYPDSERDRADGAVGFGVGRGQVTPLLEVQCPVITVAITEHHLCVPFEEKRQRPTY